MVSAVLTTYFECIRAQVIELSRRVRVRNSLYISRESCSLRSQSCSTSGVESIQDVVRIFHISQETKLLDRSHNTIGRNHLFDSQCSELGFKYIRILKGESF